MEYCEKYERKINKLIPFAMQESLRKTEKLKSGKTSEKRIGSDGKQFNFYFQTYFFIRP